MACENGVRLCVIVKKLVKKSVLAIFMGGSFARLGSVNTPTWVENSWSELTEIVVGIRILNLSSFHVLEIHADFSCNAIAKPQV